MHNRLAPTMIDRPATHPSRHTWRTFSAVLLSLLVSAGSASGATIDFEQFRPAPNTCVPSKTVQVGIARFSEGQLATDVPGALDHTTAYWDSDACGGGSRMVIEFSARVSNVHFLLENLDGNEPATTYIIRSSTPNVFHTDIVVLPAPCTSVRCFPQSSTVVNLPYTDIHGITVQPLGRLEWSYLIDNMTFGFPTPLLGTWNRLCVLGTSPACPALQAALLRLGFSFPTPTGTPTETSTPTPTETPTGTPSGCGSSGEQCCPPAAGPPCLAGACDPANNMCP